jgi:hypothetical protein
VRFISHFWGPFKNVIFEKPFLRKKITLITSKSKILVRKKKLFLLLFSEPFFVLTSWQEVLKPATKKSFFYFKFNKIEKRFFINSRINKIAEKEKSFF